MHLMNERQTSFIVILLFIFNLLIGFIFINEGIFHYDSVILTKAVENTFKTGMLQPSFRGRYGAVIINCVLYSPFFLLGHNADFTIRFSSILFHSLSIAILFLFINELFADRIQAFFGALLFSLTPFYFSPNTYGKEHGMSIFFFLLAFYLLCRGVKENKLFAVSISSFILAFSISIRESLLAAFPLYFLLYFSPMISRHPFKITIPKERFNPKFLLSLVLPFSAVLSIIFFSYLGSAFHKAIFINNAAAVNYLGLFSPMLKVAMRDLFISIPVPLFFIFIMGIIKMAYQDNSFWALFLLLWIMLIFYFGNTSSYAPRYLDIVIIPVYIFAAYALSWIYSKYKIVSYAIVIYSALSMFIFMHPMLVFRHYYNGEKQFALYAKEKTEDNAIIIAMDDSPFIDYYGNRKAIGHPVGDIRQLDDFINIIKGYLKDGRPVYLIESGLRYDPDGFLEIALKRNFSISIVGEKLSEDYHRPELKLQTYHQRLFKLNFKNNR